MPVEPCLVGGIQPMEAYAYLGPLQSHGEAPAFLGQSPQGTEGIQRDGASRLDGPTGERKHDCHTLMV